MTFIVLDRDGVINEDSTITSRHADEWIPIEGSLEAIATLTASGYRVAIATNQSGSLAVFLMNMLLRISIRNLRLS